MHPVAAIIVGAELNGLGILRSLARGGMPIRILDLDRNVPGIWSRYARSQLISGFKGRNFMSEMIEIGQQFSQRPMLFLTGEESLHAISENRDILRPHFRFRLPEDSAVKMLSDKAKFHEFASNNAFPVPRTAVLANLDDLENLAQLNFPAVLKPEDKRHVLSGQKARAVQVHDLREAVDMAIAMLQTPGGIVAQEWIEGPESNIYFTLFYRGAEGRTVSVFTGRKLRCFPRDVGSTAVCIAAPEASGILEPMTLAFADRARFEGMGSVEYKFDARRRQFLMIEPTVGRSDWQEEIATLSGVNLPLAAYRHEVGLPALREAPPRWPVVWASSLAQRAPPELLPKVYRKKDGYWRWQDPLPALAYYGKDSLRRQFERLLSNGGSMRQRSAKQ
ncbi:MAG: hypothetical protein KGQ46_00635 [Hyphomicrobiales bacterium]|nr:hypothetical protein [Hyphomicrobiales bacterium]MDE2115594.1 hypothetical protein [Hyphomicrobiales bacterium]